MKPYQRYSGMIATATSALSDLTCVDPPQQMNPLIEGLERER